MTTNTPEETREKLEHVKDLQMAFKNDSIRKLACRIVQHGLDHIVLWPDEIDLEDIPVDDRNCTGSVYRWLKNSGILIRTIDFRRSKAKDANGRTIFKYTLVNAALARTFLTRHHKEVVNPQLALL
jgi:hypothetical protein